VKFDNAVQYQNVDLTKSITVMETAATSHLYLHVSIWIFIIGCISCYSERVVVSMVGRHVYVSSSANYSSQITPSQRRCLADAARVYSMSMRCKLQKTSRCIDAQWRHVFIFVCYLCCSRGINSPISVDVVNDVNVRDFTIGYMGQACYKNTGLQ